MQFYKCAIREKGPLCLKTGFVSGDRISVWVNKLFLSFFTKVTLLFVCVFSLFGKWICFDECQMSDLLRFEQSLFSRSFEAKEIVWLFTNSSFASKSTSVFNQLLPCCVHCFHPRTRSLVPTAVTVTLEVTGSIVSWWYMFPFVWLYAKHSFLSAGSSFLNQLPSCKFSPVNFADVQLALQPVCVRSPSVTNRRRNYL